MSIFTLGILLIDMVYILFRQSVLSVISFICLETHKRYLSRQPFYLENFGSKINCSTQSKKCGAFFRYASLVDRKKPLFRFFKNKNWFVSCKTTKLIVKTI